MAEKLANIAGEPAEVGCAPDAENVSELGLAWERIRAGLRRDLGSKLFDQWLRAARPGDYCDLSRT